MRDKRFVAMHRGGRLNSEQHRLLIIWAHDCAEHVLPLFGERTDERLNVALRTAKAWERGDVSVGDARKASSGAIAVANESSNPAAMAVARAIGHAVATAHMADHSLWAAEYALKAIKSTGHSVETERKWQDDQLPTGIRELVSC
jgi:hypothetical protein